MSFLLGLITALALANYCSTSKANTLESRPLIRPVEFTLYVYDTFLSATVNIFVSFQGKSKYIDIKQTLTRKEIAMKSVILVLVSKILG